MILRDHIKAQSTIEFTFAVIVIMFLIFGMIRVFRWTGMDLANRRYAHDAVLTGSGPTVTDPSMQLNADFDRVLPLSAVYRGKLTNGNETL